MKKKVLAGVAVFVGLGGLVNACEDEPAPVAEHVLAAPSTSPAAPTTTEKPTPAPAPATVTVTTSAKPKPKPTPTPEPTVDVDLAFETVLRNEGLIPRLGDVDDAKALAKEICTAFDAGQSWSQIGLTMVNDAGADPADVGYLLGASVAGYCPEYKDKLPK